MNAPEPPLSPLAVLTAASAALAVLLSGLFTLFRMDHMTDWSWIWVLSPLWIWGAALAVVTGTVLVLGIAAMVAAEREQ